MIFFVFFFRDVTDCCWILLLLLLLFVIFFLRCGGLAMLQPRRRWTVAAVAVIVSLFADCLIAGKECSFENEENGGKIAKNNEKPRQEAFETQICRAKLL